MNMYGWVSRLGMVMREIYQYLEEACGGISALTSKAHEHMSSLAAKLCSVAISASDREWVCQASSELTCYDILGWHSSLSELLAPSICSRLHGVLQNMASYKELNGLSLSTLHAAELSLAMVDHMRSKGSSGSSSSSSAPLEHPLLTAMCRADILGDVADACSATLNPHAVHVAMLLVFLLPESQRESELGKLSDKQLSILALSFFLRADSSITSFVRSDLYARCRDRGMANSPPDTVISAVLYARDGDPYNAFDLVSALTIQVPASASTVETIAYLFAAEAICKGILSMDPRDMRTVRLTKHLQREPGLSSGLRLVFEREIKSGAPLVPIACIPCSD